MQRRSTFKKRTTAQEKEIIGLIKDAEKHGDKLGYRCVAPTLSLLAGEHRVRNTFLLFSNGIGCAYNIWKIHDLPDKYTENEELREIIGDLFIYSAEAGACRFWKEEKTADNEPKCKEADEIRDKVREEALQKLGLKK